MAVLSLRRTGILLCIFCTGLVLTAGCIQAGTSQEAEHAPPALQAAAPPADVAADLQAIIESGIEEAGVPGIQIEVATPDWTWNSAAGNASLAPATPAAPGMRFIIASVTKTFTSVAVLQLAEEGKLSLDDTIDRRLPADVAERIENASAITIRQLLDHTSGIPDYDEMEIVLTEYADPDTPVPYQYGMGEALDAGPLYPPGDGYTYSNVNYILLTLIIDEAAGVPYEDYLTRQIFVPAGMNDTFIHRTNHIPGPHMACPEDLYGNGTLQDYSSLYIQFDRGAGDIVSTVADLNRFHRALVDGRIIGQASLADMETVTTPSLHPATSVSPDATSGYGLGYSVFRSPAMNMTLYGHTGGYPGSSTFLNYWEEKDTTIAMNVNSIAGAAATNEFILIPILHYLESRI